MLRFQKSAVYQYILLYIMMLINQSCLIDTFGSPKIYMGIVFFCASMMLLRKKFRDYYVLIFGGASLFIISAVRFFVGGVGLGIWMHWMASLMLVSLAIRVSPEKFLTRFVRIVYVFAFLSLILWAASLVNIQLIQKLMFFEFRQGTNVYRSYIDAYHYTNIHALAYGGPFYVVNMQQVGRNCGIFTEPGVYQILLNSALFVIIYLKKYLDIDFKMQKKMLAVLSATIVSALSTSGILSMLAIYIPVLILRKDKQKKWLLRAATIGMTCLVADLFIRGEESIIFSVLIRKLFENGEFTLMASTGSARMGTVEVCFRSMIAHPFGIGYDQITKLLNAEITGNVAASIFTTGAACGIPMFLLIAAFLLLPVCRTTRIPWYAKLAFIFSLTNNLLSQSSEFYPYMICIPILFTVMDSCVTWRVHKENISRVGCGNRAEKL